MSGNSLGVVLSPGGLDAVGLVREVGTGPNLANCDGKRAQPTRSRSVAFGPITPEENPPSAKR